MLETAGPFKDNGSSGAPGWRRPGFGKVKRIVAGAVGSRTRSACQGLPSLDIAGLARTAGLRPGAPGGCGDDGRNLPETGCWLQAGSTKIVRRQESSSRLTGQTGQGDAGTESGSR